MKPESAAARRARKIATFVDVYLRTGNGTRAAIEAGYATSGAHVRAAELLRRSNVRSLIEQKLIRKEVHAEKTYQNLIALADGAMREAAMVCGWHRESIPDADPANRARAIEVARRANETLGRVEGLFVERIIAKLDVQHSLQGLLERIRDARANVTASRPAVAGKEAMAAIDAPPPKPEANGNGHAKDAPNDAPLPNVGDGDAGGG